MNRNTSNIVDIGLLLDSNDPLQVMRNDFIQELRTYVANKRIEINLWEPFVLKNYRG